MQNLKKNKIGFFSHKMNLNHKNNYFFELVIPKIGNNDVSHLYNYKKNSALILMGGHFENDVIPQRSIGEIFNF